MRWLIVAGLERACSGTHWFIHRRPWLWLPLPICPLSVWSYNLDRRWETGYWREPGLKSAKWKWGTQ